VVDFRDRWEQTCERLKELSKVYKKRIRGTVTDIQETYVLVLVIAC